MKKLIRMAGFTAMELLVTIAILGIFLAIAIPDYTAIVQNNAIKTLSNDLTASLMYARSEAVKRNVPVSICATSDQNYNACGSNWSMGWLIFVNPTGGTALTNTAAAPLLRVVAVDKPNATFTLSPNRNILTYQGSGFTATATGPLSIVIKSSGCTGNAGRQITLSVTGNPTLASVNCP